MEGCLPNSSSQAKADRLPPRETKPIRSRYSVFYLLVYHKNQGKVNKYTLRLMGTPSWEMEKVETATPNGGEAGPELTTVYLLSGLWLVLTYSPRKPPYEGEDHLVICLGYHTVGN